MNSLDGKVALVTGAGRGIGQAIAMRLARAGCRIVINDLDPGPAKETLGAVRDAGSDGVTCVGSVTDADMPAQLVAAATDTFGGLDVVVNNAGYTWDAVIQKMTDEQWDAINDLHLKAPFRILRAVQPVFRAQAKAERARGEEVIRKVVNISSMAGTRGNPGQVNYAAAKAGMIGMTRTLAKEWGRHRVTVNAVAYGMISTRLTVAAADGGTIEVDGRKIPVGMSEDLVEAAAASIPLGRPGTPGEAAGAVFLLCSPDANYVSGQVIECGGGLSL